MRTRRSSDDRLQGELVDVNALIAASSIGPRATRIERELTDMVMCLAEVCDVMEATGPHDCQGPDCHRCKPALRAATIRNVAHRMTMLTEPIAIDAATRKRRARAATPDRGKR